MTKFSYHRKIHFADTDAAGVVYFANLFSICHEAYEEYLVSSFNLDLRVFFRDKLSAIPIVHGEIDFVKPLFCGDLINIFLQPQLINQKVFEISYRIIKDDEMVANALTRHICINPQTRKTQALPSVFQQYFLNKT